MNGKGEPMSDLIDRQAAIEALRGYLVGKRCPDDGTLTCRLIENEVINKLPPAQPKRIRGKWVFKNDLIAIPTGYYECSECKIGRLMYKENFCPNCGAEMEVTS